MGAIIKSTAFCPDQPGHSLIENAAAAGEECLAKAGLDKRDVDMLINVGVFRDHNILEPAMATLIQQRMEINISPTDIFCRTLAFDILNGASGVLNAVQAVTAILLNQKNAIDPANALIVSSDVHPSKDIIREFPYSTLGAAMLIEFSEDPGQGFQTIEQWTSPSSYLGITASLDITLHGLSSSKSISFQTESDFEDRLFDFTVETLRDFLRRCRENQSINHTELKLISTCPYKGFGSKLAKAMGLHDYPGEDLFERYGNPNSSALTVGYHEALTSGWIQNGDRVLFAAAGAGLTLSLGLYSS